MFKPLYAAERVLDDLNINTPKDLHLLELIAWERGALVRDEYLSGAEARITIGKRRAIITISKAVDNPQRRRFNIAHEIGHLELHHAENNISICVSEDLDNWKYQKVGVNLEQAANEFASALLLPKRFFAPLCKEQIPSLNLISQLANDFDVSLTATAIRYTSFCDEPIAIVFSRNGYIQWFRGSKDFEDLREDIGIYIDVRSRLTPSTQVARFFQGHSIKTTPKRIDASAWFISGKHRSDARILEQSWAMPHYNAVLTLLWIDEDIEEDDFFLF